MTREELALVERLSRTPGVHIVETGKPSVMSSGVAFVQHGSDLLAHFVGERGWVRAVDVPFERLSFFKHFNPKDESECANLPQPCLY